MLRKKNEVKKVETEGKMKKKIKKIKYTMKEKKKKMTKD